MTSKASASIPARIASATALAGSRAKPSSGPAFDERIIGVSVAPGYTVTVPPARTIARLLTSERDCKSAEALRIRVAIETASPTIVAARNLLDRFRTMIAAKKPDDLASWIRDAAESELASFAFGIEADEAAVRAAIVEPWSNGQTEGQVTRLKLV